MLNLFEEFILLTVHEAKGTFVNLPSERLKAGLAGAVLAELALAGKIQVSNNHRLQVIDNSPTNNVVLDEALNGLKESEKERKFGFWVANLGQKIEKSRRHAVENLLQKGLVIQDDDRLVWVIPSPLKPDVKISAKQMVVRQLRSIVLAQEESQPRDIALLSLVRACGLLYLVFLRDERKLADRYIYELGINQSIKYPVIQTIQEIETAMAALVEED